MIRNCLEIIFFKRLQHYNVYLGLWFGVLKLADVTWSRKVSTCLSDKALCKVSRGLMVGVPSSPTREIRKQIKYNLSDFIQQNTNDFPINNLDDEYVVGIGYSVSVIGALEVRYIMTCCEHLVRELWALRSLECILLDRGFYLHTYYLQGNRSDLQPPCRNSLQMYFDYIFYFQNYIN